MCRWGERGGRITALLEPNSLIVRGEISARAARADLELIEVDGDDLTFVAAGERVTLELGRAAAQRWAAAIAAPPPTLARKLGITGATRLHVTGALDDAALIAAVASAGASAPSLGDADLAIVRADDRSLLCGWLQTHAGEDRVPPLWVVYTKGRTAALDEKGVRTTLRAYGFIDTKVAAVSTALTALRFVKPRP